MKTESEALMFFSTLIVLHVILIPLAYIWAKRRYDRIMKKIIEKDK